MGMLRAVMHMQMSHMERSSCTGKFKVKMAETTYKASRSSFAWRFQVEF